MRNANMVYRRTHQVVKRLAARRSAILAAARDAAAEGGMSAVQIAPIAVRANVAAGTVYRYFPSKTDLGIAVVDRYTARFGTALTAIAEDQSQSAMVMLDFYVQPYLKFAGTPDRVCLSGALAGEMLALPAEVRERVDQFFRNHQVWLTKILKRGVARGEFKLAASAPKVARFVFGALQGALLVKRTTNDLTQINDVIAVMKLQLAAR